MHTTLISTQTLYENYQDPDWAIFDCRFELTDPEHGERVYVENHVPGAVYAHLDRDLAAPPDGTNGRHPLPSVDAMGQTFSHWGIDRNVQVVGYDDRGGGFAARLWWMLRYLGHEAVAVLDGGFSAWKRAGYPLKNGVEHRQIRRFTPSVQTDMIASMEEVRARSESREARLIDARAPERYRGEQEPLDPIAGHIPGAINHFWGDNLDEDGHFRPAEALRQSYQELLGDDPPAAFIAYCGSGVTSCHNLLAMEHIGLEGTRLYTGSWSEWCSDPERPIELGSSD